MAILQSLLALCLLVFLVHPSYSSSSQPIRLSLRHIDSSKNLTKLERLQHGLQRSRARLQRLDEMVLAASSPSPSPSPTPPLEAPVSAIPGAYVMNLSIGTPPLTYPALLDTGSDLIWTQCTPCTHCYNQPTPIFNPKNSSSFSTIPCSSDLCSALPSSLCSNNACNYEYGYAGGSSTQGFLASETFTFGDSKDQVSVNDIGFGCGEDNDAEGLDASGLVGLGRGPLSLVSQLKEPRFSYCLTSMELTEHDKNTEQSTLFLGSFPSTNATLITIPLLRNPLLSTFYYLPLEGISVGNTRLNIDKSIFDIKKDGSGGVIIDSGTTLTYLEQTAYEALKEEFISQTNLTVDNSVTPGLDLCFNLPSNSSLVKIPSKLVFHFTNADLELSFENYILVISDLNVICLAMGPSSGISIFGNAQQQNMLVNYDLEKEAISFGHMNCDAL